MISKFTVNMKFIYCLIFTSNDIYLLLRFYLVSFRFPFRFVYSSKSLFDLVYWLFRPQQNEILPHCRWFIMTSIVFPFFRFSCSNGKKSFFPNLLYRQYSIVYDTMVHGLINHIRLGCVFSFIAISKCANRSWQFLRY